jgi:hypothetical protein
MDGFITAAQSAPNFAWKTRLVYLANCMDSTTLYDLKFVVYDAV